MSMVMVSRMHKNMALAVSIGLIWAGAVYGQDKAVAPAQSSKNIDAKIYGQLHVSADLLDDGIDSADYLSSNSSRLGFKGELEIDKNFKGVWQVEAEIRVDEKEQNDYFSTRNTFAGVTSAWGQVLAGRIDSPFKQLSRKADMFGDRIGDSRNLISAGGAGWDQRPDNLVLACSPDYNGITAQAGQKMSESAQDTGMTSAGVNYNRMDWSIGAAYERHGNALTPIDSNSDGTNDTPSAKSETGIRIAGSVKFDSLTLSALFQRLFDVGGIAGNDSDAYGAGVAYKIEKETLKAQYYTTDGGSGSGKGADLWVAGLDHNLSENVTVYLAYAMAVNDSKAKFTMSGGGHGNKVTPAKGDDSSGASLGLIVKF